MEIAVDCEEERKNQCYQQRDDKPSPADQRTQGSHACAVGDRHGTFLIHLDASELLGRFWRMQEFEESVDRRFALCRNHENEVLGVGVSSTLEILQSRLDAVDCDEAQIAFLGNHLQVRHGRQRCGCALGNICVVLVGGRDRNVRALPSPILGCAETREQRGHELGIAL